MNRRVCRPEDRWQGGNLWLSNSALRKLIEKKRFKKQHCVNTSHDRPAGRRAEPRRQLARRSGSQAQAGPAAAYRAMAGVVEDGCASATRDAGDSGCGDSRLRRTSSDSDETATDVDVIEDHTPADVIDHSGNDEPPTTLLTREYR